jgi:hypothetical protein
MCAIHFACDLIESKPMGAYIILTDSLASIGGLKSTGISYRTNDRLFLTRRSLRYLGELGYDIEVTKVATLPNIGKSREKFTTLIQQQKRQQIAYSVFENSTPPFFVA